MFGWINGCDPRRYGLDFGLWTRSARQDLGQEGSGACGRTPRPAAVVSAASAVNARGGFWYCTYQGRLNAELFVALLRRMMRRRTKPVHLVLDGLPAHKTTLVKAYVASTKGMLTLHLLPGYAPELNPDELVWSHMKRTVGCQSPTPARRKAAGEDPRRNSAPSSACVG